MRRLNQLDYFDIQEFRSPAREGEVIESGSVEKPEAPKSKTPEGHCPALFSFFIGDENYYDPTDTTEG